MGKQDQLHSAFLDRIAGRFAELPSWTRSLTYAVFLAIVAYLDYADGQTLQFSVFYALLVLATGWFEGAAASVVWGLAAATATLLADYSAIGVPLVELLNQSLRTILWLMLGLGAANRKKRSKQIAEQQTNLARAYERLNFDLEAARRVQETLLAEPLPQDPRVALTLQRRSARGLGGDFVEVRCEGDQLYICLADVSGKGAPAALITTMLRGLLRDLEVREPARVLPVLNRRITPYLPEMMFITCFFAVMDLNSGRLTYAGAGHEPGWLRRADNKVEELLSTGLPLGVMEDMEVEQGEVTLEPNELLILYTDGLTTAKLPDGTRVEEEALLERVAQGKPAEALSQELFCLVTDQEQEDDVVILTLSSQSHLLRRK